MRFVLKLFLLVLTISSLSLGHQVIIQDHDLSPQIIVRERYNTDALRLLRTQVETDISEFQRQPGNLLSSRFHFSGGASFQGRLREIQLAHGSLLSGRHLEEFANSFAPDSWEFVRNGFVAMAYPDPGTFDLQHYHFKLMNEEELDGIKCYLIEVNPTSKKRGLFNGRIWVEKETLTIIRFDGIYQGSNIFEKYFHFDSRRMKDPNGLWVPSIVSSDEMDCSCCHPVMDCPSCYPINFPWNKLHFQAVTHFSGYNTGLQTGRRAYSHNTHFRPVRVDYDAGR
jgi:Outer membrane lipoprotein-sorting protein